MDSYSHDPPNNQSKELRQPSSGELEIHEPLQPENHLNKYDRERLQRGLRYIGGAAKRRITPRTQEFLKLQKEAYENALDGGTPGTDPRAVVQAMDKFYYSAAYYFRPRSLNEYEHLMHYVKLRRLDLMANYGNQFGQKIHESRANHKTVGAKADTDMREATLKPEPSTTYRTIANELAAVDMYDLRDRVWVACEIHAFDVIHMLSLIYDWREENRILRNKIQHYISDCRWEDLARHISRDLNDLLKVSSDPETAAKYEKILLGIRNKYFDVTNRIDPEYWVPNEKAKKLFQQKLAREKKREGEGKVLIFEQQE